jgi:hypothetical protein
MAMRFGYVIHTKQGRHSEGVLVLHDNVRPHTATHSREMLWGLKFEVLNHPEHIPDPAPLDFHLFEPLNGALRAGDDIKEEVHDWLHILDKNLFFSCHQKACGLPVKCQEAGRQCTKVLHLSLYILNLIVEIKNKCRNFLNHLCSVKIKRIKIIFLQIYCNWSHTTHIKVLIFHHSPSPKVSRV